MLIFILVVYINYNQKRGLKMSNLVVEIVTGLITVIGVVSTDGKSEQLKKCLF